LFEKDLSKSLILQQHEALERRLAKNHPKRPEVEEKLGSFQAGYRGEKTLNYFLSLLPPKKYHIFHDIRLPNGPTFFQIDAILISGKMGYIIDNKNYGGTLVLDKHQLTQDLNNNSKIYQNPISQTHRHIILLKDFFDQNHITTIPLENLVCFSNSYSIVKIAAGYNEAEKRVTKADNILRKIAEFEKYYKQELLTPKDIGKMKRVLLSKHTPNRIDIFKTYNLGQRDIITGVQCPVCLHIPMLYKGRYWECPICEIISKDAHLPAINDYFLLIKPWFTNSELRIFLQLPSPRAAAYLISFLDLPTTGTNKGRIYHQPRPKQ
jgi:hypothetical protein